MKKSILATALLCAACQAGLRAQPTFNETIYNSNYHYFGNSIALLPDEELVVGSVTAPAATNTVSKFTLMKFGPVGNPLWPAYTRDSSWGIERITETQDPTGIGVLVVSDLPDFLLVRKYTSSLSLSWSIEVKKVNLGQFSNFYSGIDVERDTDMNGNDKNYYIVFSGGPTDSTYSLDNGLSIAKVDANGTLVWHKVYTDVNRAGYQSWEAIQDRPYSITSFPDPNDPNQKLYAVAGNRLFYAPGLAVSTFYMVIDNSGSIINQYKELQMPQTHYNPDILWDGDSLAISFMHLNVQNQPSAFALMKTDIGFNLFRGKYYINDCENYANSLTMSGYDSIYVGVFTDKWGGTFDSVINGTDKNYLIGGWSGKCFQNQNAYAFGNPMFLKIDKITLDPVDFKRYNVYQDVRTAGYHRTDKNEQNLIPTNTSGYYPWGSGSTYSLRFMRTDKLLRTCGYMDMDVDEYDLEPDSVDHWYEVTDYTDWDPITLTEVSYDPDIDFCDPSNNPDYYKTNSVVNINNPSFIVSIMPTVITDRSETIFCHVNSPENKRIEIGIYNVMGQQVYSNSYDVKAGENVIKIMNVNMPAGLNIVKISSRNRVVKTEKLIVQY